MSNPIRITRGRNCRFEVQFSYILDDDDVYTSQIRTGPSNRFALIAEWVITKKENSNNTLIFTLDDSITETLEYPHGWMDIKRVADGEPLVVIEYAIEVVISDRITE